MMTRGEVQAEARKWLRVPYLHRGRTADGLDCIGFLIVVGRAFDIPHEDEHDYSLWPRQDLMILKKLGRFLDAIPPSTALPGTIGVFAERRLPGHVGIFSEKHNAVHLIHARISPGCVLEEAWQHMPRNHLRLIGLFGFPGLDL
jgi:cell wall-associated NlpC family hydrolase